MKKEKIKVGGIKNDMLYLREDLWLDTPEKPRKYYLNDFGYLYEFNFLKRDVERNPNLHSEFIYKKPLKIKGKNISKIYLNTAPKYGLTTKLNMDNGVNPINPYFGSDLMEHIKILPKNEYNKIWK
jgi:hypothetical protein